MIMASVCLATMAQKQFATTAINCNVDSVVDPQHAGYGTSQAE